MGIPSVLINKNTKKIVKKGDYPSLVVGNVPGLEDHLQWLIIRIDEIPIYNENYYRVVRVLPDLNNLDTFNEHPDYPGTGVKEYHIQYQTVKLDVLYIKEKVDDINIEKNDLLLNGSNRARKNMTLALRILIRKSNGAQIEVAEQVFLDNFLVKLNKILLNEVYATSLKEDIDNSLEPDITTGWET